MDHLEKFFLALEYIDEWNSREYKAFSLHPRSYDNYLRLQEQLNHILHFLKLTIDVELIDVDGCYIQMLTLSSKDDKNYLIRVNDEEFMTYLDDTIYIISIPDPLIMDSCQITYNRENDSIVSITSMMNTDLEKITVQISKDEDNITSLIIPWEKNYCRFAAGMRGKDKIGELYLYDDEEVTLKYSLKNKDHMIDISLISSYLVNTNSLYSLSYIYKDNKYPEYNIEKEYMANVKEVRSRLLNTLKQGSAIEDFMKIINNSIKSADKTLYDRIQKEYPVFEQFIHFQKEEKEKTLKYLN